MGIGQHRVAARCVDQIRDPVPGGEWRVGPLQHQHAPPGRALDVPAQPGDARAQGRDDRVAASCCAEHRADRADRREHLFERARIERDDLRGASEVAQRIVDPFDVDGANRAEILGEHQLGIETGQRLLVEPVEIFARRDALDDERIDLGRAQPFGQCRRRNDAAAARFRRVIAFERDTNEIVAAAHGEHDLCRRGEQ